MSKLSYKGYYTNIQYNEKDQVLFGKIEGIMDLVNFESDSAKEIEKEFHDAVDDYLEFCAQTGKQPEKPFKGSFNVRIAPELHKELFIASQKESTSLNSLVEKAINNYIHGNNITPTIKIYNYPQTMMTQTSYLDANNFNNMVTSPLDFSNIN